MGLGLFSTDYNNATGKGIFEEKRQFKKGPSIISCHLRQILCFRDGGCACLAWHGDS